MLMPSERPYLQQDYQREKTSALTWLISALVAGFALQIVADSTWLNRGPTLLTWLGLSGDALRSGWIWTLLSHAFLHSTEFIPHAVGTLLAFYLLGRELLPLLGAPRFLGLTAAATIIGGLCWTSAHPEPGHPPHIGATSATAALLIVYTGLAPHRPLRFLFLFLVPITVTPARLAITLTVTTTLVIFAYELPHQPLPWDVTIASTAHLGGILTGYGYFRFFHQKQFALPWSRATASLARAQSHSGQVHTSPHAIAPRHNPASAPAPDHQDRRVQIDRILDKINGEGLGSLTPEEKYALDAAKNFLRQP